MNQPQTIPDDDTTDVDHLSAIPDLRPDWLADYGQLGEPIHLRDSFIELVARVKGLGGLLWNDDIDPEDAVAAGRMLRSLANEADAYIECWGRAYSRAKAHDGAQPAVPGVSPEVVADLQVRVMSALTDWLPVSRVLPLCELFDGALARDTQAISDAVAKLGPTGAEYLGSSRVSDDDAVSTTPRVAHELRTAARSLLAIVDLARQAERDPDDTTTLTDATRCARRLEGLALRLAAGEEGSSDE